MNCSNCGNVVNPGEKFCNKCGAPILVNNGGQDVNMNNNLNNNPNPINNPNVNNMMPNQNVGVNVQNQNMAVNSNPNMPQNNVNPNPNMVQNNVNPYNNQPSNNKGNKTAIIIVAVVAVIAIAVGLYFLLGNKGDDDNNPPAVNPGNGGGSTPVDTTDRIALGNYSFVLPDGYMYKIEDGFLDFAPADQSYLAGIYIHEGLSYSGVYLPQKDDLKQKMIDSGVNVLNMYTKSFGGLEYLVYEQEFEGMTCYDAFAQIGSYDTVEVLGVLYSSTVDTMYTDVASIIKNANSTSSFAGEISDDGKAEFNSTDKEFNIDMFK